MSVNQCEVPQDMSFIELTMILGSTFSLPVMLMVKKMASTFGVGTTLFSIIVGNLILWLLSIAVMTMSIPGRSNALENIQNYLGKTGSIVMWLALSASLFTWFIYQISSVVVSVENAFQVENSDVFIRIGAFLGLVSTILAVFGLKFIKKFTIFAFPFVFIYVVYSLFSSKLSFEGSWVFAFDLKAVMMTVLFYLPGVINLPTLFRHAKSKSDCFFGITTTFLLLAFFEVSTLWFSFDASNTIFLFNSGFSFFSIATLAFFLLTLLSVNLLNIYYISMCWETYVPNFDGVKGRAITGLLGSSAFTFLQIQTPIVFLGNLTNCFIANLGIVLIMGFLIRIIIHHRPRKFEKFLSAIAWIVGCLVSSFYVINTPHGSSKALFMGCITSIFMGFLILFIEENIWALKKILNGTDKSSEFG